MSKTVLFRVSHLFSVFWLSSVAALSRLDIMLYWEHVTISRSKLYRNKDVCGALYMLLFLYLNFVKTVCFLSKSLRACYFVHIKNMDNQNIDFWKSKFSSKSFSHCLIIWWFDGSVWKSVGKSVSGSAESVDLYTILKDGVELDGSLTWPTRLDGPHVSLRKMYDGINQNRKRSVGLWERNKRLESDGISADLNRIRLRSSTS